MCMLRATQPNLLNCCETLIQTDMDGQTEDESGRTNRGRTTTTDGRADRGRWHQPGWPYQTRVRTSRRRTRDTRTDCAARSLVAPVGLYCRCRFWLAPCSLAHLPPARRCGYSTFAPIDNLVWECRFSVEFLASDVRACYHSGAFRP